MHGLIGVKTTERGNISHPARARCARARGGQGHESHVSRGTRGRAVDARDTPRGDARRESRERDGCRNPDDATGTTSIESCIDLI